MSNRRLSFHSVRSSLLALTIGASAGLFAGAVAHGQQTPQLQESGAPSVENSKFQAVGVVNANAVFVAQRCQ
jgi:hypothetical protein